MYHVYVLKSEKTGRSYIGHTKDLNKRLEEHNSGKSRSTRHGRPWHLVYYETFSTRQEAMKREMFYKHEYTGVAIILQPRLFLLTCVTHSLV
ncbi:MAG: GIY-YIG nuclease family protein [Nitrospirae bacterium]|nr:MAG: GIY-YIG nuclease family protein [Nitrospirota bacterium]